MEKKWYIVYEDFAAETKKLLELGLIEVVGYKDGYPMYDSTEAGKAILGALNTK